MKNKEFNPVVQWAKFIVVLILYLLFLYWVKSWRISIVRRPGRRIPQTRNTSVWIISVVERCLASIPSATTPMPT